MKNKFNKICKRKSRVAEHKLLKIEKGSCNVQEKLKLATKKVA